MLIIYPSLISVSLVNRISLPAVIISQKTSEIVSDPLNLPQTRLRTWGVDMKSRATCASLLVEMTRWASSSRNGGLLDFRHNGKWVTGLLLFPMTYLDLSWLQISLSALQLFFYLDLLLFLDQKEEWQKCSLEVCFGKQSSNLAAVDLYPVCYASHVCTVKHTL